jgi:hypothetical protein
MVRDESTVMTKEQWDTFVKGEVMNFLVVNHIEKITVDDGAGKKAVVKINRNGEYKVQITSNETL